MKKLPIVIIGLMLLVLPFAAATHEGGKRHGGDSGLPFVGCSEYNLQLRSGATYNGFSFDENRKYYRFPVVLDGKKSAISLNGQSVSLGKQYVGVDINRDGVNDASIRMVNNYVGVAIVRVSVAC